MTRRSALVATNQLGVIGGSEVVALEWTKLLQAFGFEVEVFANWLGEPMRSLFRTKTGVEPTTEPGAVRPFRHDLVYAQHQTLPLFDYAPAADDRTATRIILGRLSRRHYLESGGWATDRLLADLVLANSALTEEHLTALGMPVPILNFRNGAPPDFFHPFAAKPKRPQNILVVSNHAEPTLVEAAGWLRRLARVRWVGRKRGKAMLVEPEMIRAQDLVIGIGKTVQYALTARIPVFVYDHFGGPGYLRPGNIEAAERFSFSGRCCERRRDGRTLAEEIMGDYRSGVAFARSVPDSWLARFDLKGVVETAIGGPAGDNIVRRARLAADPMFGQEVLLAHYVREEYREKLESRGSLVSRTWRRLRTRLAGGYGGS
ncbi:hypothetical protein [Prosthecomicrobium pneumaticum]|uniref:Glycosyltransferase subfamily 4-like N-terminal domain-containing protein n=1 Tax=Prosthecomicrobium pneumaticum TaxID=81895 RepID=A0A7W9FJP0_9HYPH|nr:hypothetical protein [Prosthecomicrobium pneumaticum]MBB5751781.1 hypothetical protein [Prosthecomicrobium pneumaticum]